MRFPRSCGIALAAGLIASLASTGIPAAASTPAAGPLPRAGIAVQPQRLVDTRSSQRVVPGATLRVPVPAATSAGATAVTVNLTAVDALGAGYVTAWPCNQAPPATSVLNFRPGHPDANLAAMAFGGEVCIQTSAPVHVIVDLMGWFTGANEFRGSPPNRMLDTRGGPTLQPFQPRTLAVGGQPGIGAGAAAVALNVTVTQPQADGYVVAYPCGGAVPATSTVNFRAGEDVANLTVVAPASGNVCFLSSVPTHLLVDSFGWVPSGGGLIAQPPGRLLDTRQSNWPYGAAKSTSTLTVQVSGRAGIPNNADSALLTVTAVDTSSTGYVTVWPCDQPLPGTSIVNTWSGSLRSNLAFVKLSADGTACLQAKTDSGATVQLIADAVGYTTGGPNRSDPPAAPVPPTPPTTPTPPTPGNPTGHFTTLPPGSALPTDAECASRVRPAAEVRADNNTANHTTWSSQPGISFPLGARATGNYTGTTDEIIQWAACKWGIDEDIVRAQVAKESWWNQDALGDQTGQNCAPVSPQTNPCGESIGLMQVRWFYHQPAFQGAVKSSAYNLDYSYSVWRDCFEGNATWLNTVERGKDYAKGDAWGCVGLWFSGRWYTQAANEYIAAVQGYMNQRVWESADFKNG
jgi:autotransporter family porin